MLGHVKQVIQNRFLKHYQKGYTAEVERHCYSQRIKLEERAKSGERYLHEPIGDMAPEFCAGSSANSSAKGNANSRAEGNANSRAVGAGKQRIRVVGFHEIEGAFPLAECREELIVLVDQQKGRLSRRALGRMKTLFAEHPDWDMMYGDEDHIYGWNRLAPWMKPDFSPDTLLAFPYIGGCIAFRKEKYAQITWIEETDGDTKVYDFLLKCSECGTKIVHVPEMFYHREISKEQYQAYLKLDRSDSCVMTADENMPWALPWADQERYSEIRLEAMRRRGYPGRLEEDRFGILQPVYDILPGMSGKKPLVSIIIPSKDQVETLERCLRSIRAHSAYSDYEILVIDNGSAETARRRIEELGAELDFSYYYEPMEFNFSVMINYGAARARGEYVLLLNDDCEVMQDDWLIRMLGQAQLPHVGAVGAKLLYPDSDLIQHAGVTNMAAGPAHKLQGNSDAQSYFYGKNRFCYNYVGVTAACLLISKQKFEQAGGFDERLKVAFNDVDFCFKLCERRLYQVMRNDVVLYHYESLSRGNDLLSEEKLKRLMRERDTLYGLHPQFLERDPFYHVNLFGYMSDYVINYQYEYDRADRYTATSVRPVKVKPEWYNESIMITVERAGKKRFSDRSTERAAYQIGGWAYVLNQDNCRYKLSILLKKEDGSFVEAEALRCYRPDAVKILPEQKNIEISGFAVSMPRGTLPAGTYGVYLLMKDRCSRQRLLKDSGAVLTVDA